MQQQQAFLWMLSCYSCGGATCIGHLFHHLKDLLVSRTSGKQQKDPDLDLVGVLTLMKRRRDLFSHYFFDRGHSTPPW